MKYINFSHCYYHFFIEILNSNQTDINLEVTLIKIKCSKFKKNIYKSL